MASLEEIRRWLRGKDVDGLPSKELSKRKENERIWADKIERHEKKINKKKMKRFRGKYQISSDGFDALLRFGKHKGKKLSEIMRKDVSYIQWLSRELGEKDIDLKELTMKYLSGELPRPTTHSTGVDITDMDEGDIYDVSPRKLETIHI